jgi:hypothetical protein
MVALRQGLAYRPNRMWPFWPMATRRSDKAYELASINPGSPNPEAVAQVAEPERAAR